MSRTIHICEYCGFVALKQFSQCKNCDTMSDGIRYKHYQKEEVEKISNEEIFKLINKFNSIVTNTDFVDTNKMDKKLLDEEIKKFKREFSKEFEIMIDNKLNSNVDIDKFKKLSDKVETIMNIVENKKLKTITDITNSNSTSSNGVIELNQKLAFKEREIVKFKKEISELKKNQLDIDKFNMLKIDYKKSKEMIKNGEKEYTNLKEKYDDLLFKLVETEKKNDELKKQLTNKQTTKKQTINKQTTKHKSKMVIKKPIMKNMSKWSDDEIKLLKKLYTKNKKFKKDDRDNKIFLEMEKNGFKRSQKSINTKISRIGLIKKKK